MQVLLNKRWQFELFSKKLGRFMDPKERSAVSLGITPEGYVFVRDDPMDVMLLHYTGKADDKGEPLIEGDIVECQYITEFGSTMPVRGIVKYAVEDERYVIDVFTAGGDNQSGSVAGAVKIGNVFLDNELANEVYTGKKKEEA